MSTRTELIKRNEKRSYGRMRTLIPLLLNFELLGEVLVLLPLDGGADSTIVDKVAAVSNLLLVQVRLLECLVLEKVIRAENEHELEPGLIARVGAFLEVL